MPSMVNPARRSSTSIMTLPGRGASGSGQSRRHSDNCKVRTQAQTRTRC
jgi:hypothetical protein